MFGQDMSKLSEKMIEQANNLSLIAEASEAVAREAAAVLAAVNQ